MNEAVCKAVTFTFVCLHDIISLKHLRNVKLNTAKNATNNIPGINIDFRYYFLLVSFMSNFKSDMWCKRAILNWLFVYSNIVLFLREPPLGEMRVRLELKRKYNNNLLQLFITVTIKTRNVNIIRKAFR